MLFRLPTGNLRFAPPWPRVSYDSRHLGNTGGARCLTRSGRAGRRQHPGPRRSFGNLGRRRWSTHVGRDGSPRLASPSSPSSWPALAVRTTARPRLSGGRPFPTQWSVKSHLPKEIPDPRTPTTGRGFHVNYSSPPLNPAQAGPSVQFAQIMRDQIAASGIPPANYIGSNGLYGRSDLTGLNLAQYPSILIELGNMKNPRRLRVDEDARGSAEVRRRGRPRYRGLPGHPAEIADDDHLGESGVTVTSDAFRLNTAPPYETYRSSSSTSAKSSGSYSSSSASGV